MLIVGMLIRVYNLSGLVAGFNTASPEKKAAYNEKKMTRFIGMSLLSSAAILIIGGILMAMNVAPVASMIASWVIWMATIIGVVLFINLSPQFRKRV